MNEKETEEWEREKSSRKVLYFSSCNFQVAAVIIIIIIIIISSSSSIVVVSVPSAVAPTLPLLGPSKNVAPDSDVLSAYNKSDINTTWKI
jgi:hypothetical protein